MQEVEIDRRGRHRSAWLALLAVLVVLAGCCAWVAGIAHRGYDYDEVLRAHAIWLSAQGLRPYHDFMDYQPPFSGVLAALVPVDRDPSVSLHLLRAGAALGNLLFLAGLVAIARARRVASLSGCVLVTAVIAFHPRVLGFLAEFRMDGWGYAVLTWTIAWFLVSRSASRYFLLAFLTGLVDLFLCPKLAFLPVMLVGVELRHWVSLRSVAEIRPRSREAVVLGAAALGFRSSLDAAESGHPLTSSRSPSLWSCRRCRVPTSSTTHRGSYSARCSPSVAFDRASGRLAAASRPLLALRVGRGFVPDLRAWSIGQIAR